MMSSRKNRPRGNVVRGPFAKKKPSARQANPVEEKAATGINIKQLMMVGGVTALTGTIVGAVAMEIYRHLRPRIPIPMPGQQPQPMVAPNPGYPLPPQQMMPMGWPPQSTPQYAGQPAFVPQAVQQIGAFPQQPIAPTYPYSNPALPPVSSATPVLPHGPQAEAEPLSRPELAQWQRRLEGWERTLDRRDTQES